MDHAKQKSTRVPPKAVALEKLLLRFAKLGDTLLSCDMFDQYGPRDAESQRHFAKLAEEAGAERKKVAGELEALSRSTWAKQPATIRAWAEAHVALLERFVATRAADPSHDTACFVARKEIAAWREVADGKQPYVDGNVHYISVDPAQHAELFGPIRG